MGEAGGHRMSGTLDDRFFDFAFQMLNYALEFVGSPGYASLRFTDVLEKTVSLALDVDGVEGKPFYEGLRGRFVERGAASDSTREEFLDELLSLFVDEWRRR